MKKIITLVFLSIVSSLLCMNSTENRRSLVDEKENVSFLNFRRIYLEKTGDNHEAMVARCYVVYQGMIDGKVISDSSDFVVKQRLVSMGVCHLEDNFLVLRGFHIEDTLTVLLGCNKRIKK